MRFSCNVCGENNQFPQEDLGRENPSCVSCGSNVRLRGFLRMLALELFGVALPLPDFPRVRGLRGIGLSDSEVYTALLAERFDYRNTFYHREPRFDITNPPPEEFGQYDFVLSAEVFEHVPPPVEAALANAFRLLKPHGVLLMSVPYSLEATTTEHFPQLYEFGFGQIADKTVLLNRTRDGQLQLFDNLIFHGGPGVALEMRQFSETELKRSLIAAGFTGVRIYSEDHPSFGVIWSGACSLPIAARKGEFSTSFEATRDIMEEWWTLKEKFDHMKQENVDAMETLNRSRWFRLGRKLRLL